MAEPPEEPPGGTFGEPPEESQEDRGHRFEEPREESRNDPAGWVDEPPPHEHATEESRGEFHDEPPHEPYRASHEPLGEFHDEPRYEHGSQEPLGEFHDEPPNEPYRASQESRGEFHDEPPHEHGPQESRGEFYDESPHEPYRASHESRGEFHDEPPYERAAGSPDDPYAPSGRSFEDLPWDRPDDPDAPAPPRGRFRDGRGGGGFFGSRRRGGSEEGEEELQDQPTGELHEPLDQPTGELYEDGPPDELPVASPMDLLGDLGEEVHSPNEIAQRRAQERAHRRRAGRQRLLLLVLGLVVAIVIILLVTSTGSTPKTTIPPAPASPLARAGTGPGYLSAGTAAALPGNILVADSNNDRLVVISPKGQVVWTKPRTGPGDAFLSRTGKSIIVTEPGSFVLLQVSVSDGKILYLYGHSGRPGSGANRLHDPQSAQELSDGRLVVADKSNCRVLFLEPPRIHHPVATFGTPGSCLHDPPKNLGYPEAVFPQFGGTGVVVTELNPAWVDVLSSTGTVLSELRVPGLSVPDDANEYASDKLIATSHSHPGAVEEFDTSGRVTWSYDPASGAGELDRPTLAEVLPNGDVLVCDAGNDRIVVIDPQTKAIVWQYGHRHAAGRKPGYLHTPDSAILVSGGA